MSFGSVLWPRRPRSWESLRRMPTTTRDSRACRHTGQTFIDLHSTGTFSRSGCSGVRSAAWQRAAGSLEVCGLFAVDGFGGRARHAPHQPCRSTWRLWRPRDRRSRPPRAAAAQWGWELCRVLLHTHPHHAPDMSLRDRCEALNATRCHRIIIGTPTSDPVQRTYIRGTALFRDGLEPEWSTTEYDDTPDCT